MKTDIKKTVIEMKDKNRHTRLSQRYINEISKTIFSFSSSLSMSLAFKLTHVVKGRNVCRNLICHGSVRWIALGWAAGALASDLCSATVGTFDTIPNRCTGQVQVGDKKERSSDLNSAWKYAVSEGRRVSWNLSKYNIKIGYCPYNLVYFSPRAVRRDRLALWHKMSWHTTVSTSGCGRHWSAYAVLPLAS